MLNKDADFRVIRDEQDFLALRKQWDALHSQHDEEFPERSFFWACAAWETIARPKGHRLHIIIGESDGELVLVLPLVVQREWPFRIGRWLGPEFGEYSDVLVKQCEASQRWTILAWTLTASYFHMLRLPAIREDTKIWAHAERMPSLQRTITSAPYVDCSPWPDWQTYLTARSKAFRTELARSWKKLDQVGEPRIIEINRRDQVLDTIAWIDGERTKRFAHTTYGAKILRTKTEFCSRICLDALESGRLVMREIHAADGRIAALWTIRSGRRLHSLTFGWDQTRKNCAPGRLIVSESVKWAIEHNIKTYDLGIGKDRYKYHYADKQVVVATDVVIAFGMFDRVLLGGLVAARALRRGFHKLSFKPSVASFTAAALQ